MNLLPKIQEINFFVQTNQQPPKKERGALPSTFYLYGLEDNNNNVLFILTKIKTTGYNTTLYHIVHTSYIFTTKIQYNEENISQILNLLSLPDLKDKIGCDNSGGFKGIGAISLSPNFRLIFDNKTKKYTCLRNKNIIVCGLQQMHQNVSANTDYWPFYETSIDRLILPATRISSISVDVQELTYDDLTKYSIFTNLKKLPDLQYLLPNLLPNLLPDSPNLLPDSPNLLPDLPNLLFNQKIKKIEKSEEEIEEEFILSKKEEISIVEKNNTIEDWESLL